MSTIFITLNARARLVVHLHRQTVQVLLGPASTLRRSLKADTPLKLPQAEIQKETGRLRLAEESPRKNFNLVVPSYRRLKFTSILSATSTASPFLIPGLNFHCSTASIALSSSPKPTLRAILTISTEPSLRTMVSKITVP